MRTEMSNRNLWWARIKYIENFEDCVPVCQLFECDEHMQKKSPFQPQHLNDFEPEKYYIVQTNKFNKFQSKSQDHYYALVGYLVESRHDIESKDFQWPDILDVSFKPRERCDKCQAIEENGSKNIKKKRKTSRMCCWFDKKKLYPLFSLITELRNKSENTKVSINKWSINVKNIYRETKKRMYTDLCIYVPRLHGPDISHLRFSLMDFFRLVEKWNNRLKMRYLLLLEKFEDIFCEIDNLHTGTTSLPITVFEIVRLLDTKLVDLRLAFLRFYCFLLSLKEKILTIEEQFVVLTRDIGNIGIEVDIAVTVYTHYASAILESLSEMQELITKDI